MSAFDSYVQAKFHGGSIPGGPTFTVVHDAETPLKVGYCDSIVEFFRLGPAKETSAHAMVDPSKAVKMLPDNVVAYAAGPTANTFGWHLEQAGYASFTRDQWTTPDGLGQLQRVGACLREVHDQWGIPKRWITDDQLRAAAKGDRAQGGITTHQQISRVFPNDTTHTDPEERYPRDLLLPVVLGSIPPALPDVQEDDMPTIIVQPGENITLPTGSEKTTMDLWVACDNPRGLTGVDGKVIEGGAARIALQQSVSPIQWRPVADGGLAGSKADPWTARVPLGATGSVIGLSYAASVLNVGELPLTLLLTPHKP